MSQKCQACKIAMDMLTSTVTADGVLIRTHYWCPSCGQREITIEHNPRYVAVAKAVPLPPSKSRRSVTVDSGYLQTRCCTVCGEVMREPTSDGVCHLCAEGNS